MPKISGLFNYVVERKDYIPIHITVRQNDLLLTVTSNICEIPFDNSEFLNDSTYYPHLRIDREYESIISIYKSRRNLSYCHATEYFKNGENIIEVHYHFDQHGSYSHVKCSYYPYGKHSLKNPYQSLTFKQQRILEKRAINAYVPILKDLLEKKKNAHKELQNQVTEAFAALEKMDGNATKEQLLNTITRIIALIQKKDKLEDRKSINVADPRISFLNKIIANLNLQNEPVTTVPTQQEKTSTSLPNATATIEASKKDLTSKKSPVSKRKDLNVQINKCKVAINSLLQCSATENSIVYFDQKSALREDLLLLTIEKQKTVAEQKEINKLWKTFDELKTEIDIFEDALQHGDLALVQTLFPYCQNSICDKFLYDSLVHWVYLCTNPDSPEAALILKQREIFDFLNENHELFGNTIFLMSYVFISYEVLKNSPNLLALAYINNNMIVFEGLLKYGFNPYLPWFLSGGVLYNALDIILNRPAHNEIFVQKLIEYGYNFDEKYELEVRTKEPQNKNGKHNLHILEYQTLAVQNGEYFPLRTLVTENYTPYNFKSLYSLLFETSDLISLLYAFAAGILTPNNCEINPNAKGIEFYCTKSPSQTFDITSNGIDSFIHVSLGFQSENASDYFQKLCNEIKKRFIQLDNCNILISSMQSTIRILQDLNHFLSAAMHYISLAAIYLASRTSLSLPELNSCIDNLTKAANCLKLHLAVSTKISKVRAQQIEIMNCLLYITILNAILSIGKLTPDLIKNYNITLKGLNDTVSNTKQSAEKLQGIKVKLAYFNKYAADNFQKPIDTVKIKQVQANKPAPCF